VIDDRVADEMVPENEAVATLFEGTELSEAAVELAKPLVVAGL
jgi:hypothetical protein